MPHYIALVHKDTASRYGLSFPDIPGVIAVGDTPDDAIAQAAEAMSFAAEDWQELTGESFPPPRTLDALRNDDVFLEDAKDAVVAAIRLAAALHRAA